MVTKQYSITSLKDSNLALQLVLFSLCYKTHKVIYMDAAMIKKIHSQHAAKTMANAGIPTFHCVCIVFYNYHEQTDS